MPLLLPSNCSCYNLHLPQLDAEAAAGLDECAIKRFSLDVRTGAATMLARSGIFVHGGLTIPLNLQEITSVNLQQELIMHFAREREDSNSFHSLSQWISKEVFFLDLISRRWERVPTMHESDFADNRRSFERSVLSERLFHSICYCNGSLFLFGGLTVSPQSDYELIASNELWRLDLLTKVWSLVSADPLVTRRFNCQMHVLYETDKEFDTKLIIVGGLNNMDQPVTLVDVYNLDTNRWESTEQWNLENDLHDVFINVGGKAEALGAEKAFSLLVEQNEAQLPTLAVYSPAEEDMCESNRTDYAIEANPLFALPLMPDADGVRMHIYDNSDRRRQRLHIAYNLQWPTGDKFGYNIVISGFHPNLQSHNFHCFLYNITSGKWTRLSINCGELNTAKHRFWKLFLWESHHKALLLGSKVDAESLPSVQRFDRLLSLGLHITNLFHSAQTEVRDSRSSSARGKPLTSSVQSETDQFEKYSRYVAPPSEITSIRSVFPSYSMVLGKDSLEIYNRLLADFEFITEDNETVAVPSFLLRKRWGRYFDRLLATTYVQVASDPRIGENYPRTVHLASGTTIYSGNSPHTSSSTTSNIMMNEEKPATSQGSLDTFFSRHRTSTQSAQSNTPPVERKSAALFFNTSEAVRTSENSSNKFHTTQSDGSDPDVGGGDVLSCSTDDTPDPIISLEDISEHTSLRRHSTANSGVTSSSGGMIFRVPFRPSTESSKHSTPPPISLDPNEVSEPMRIIGPANRKNSSSSYSAMFSDDYLRSNPSQLRKVSQSLGNDNLLQATLGANSPLGSRKASIASTSSSISHVSSSSDRMGEPIYKNNGSDEVLNLNIPIPPMQPAPSDPLPPLPSHPPHDFNLSKRLSEQFGPDIRHRTSTSPLSSRRSSLHPDIVQHLSQEGGFSNKIDEAFAGDPFQRSLSENNELKTPHNERNSLASNSESIGSRNNSSVDLSVEPLLVPRSLYMPWPTETVKAFAEFFYTGQIAGKWPLSPVSVGLLNMAKIYEVPLLFDLMLEVFYSIIGKKEESLFVISKSIKEAFLSRVTALFDGDSKGMDEYLSNHLQFQDYKAIERSLNNIDDGYFDIDHLRKASAAFSVSTVSSTATHDQIEKLGSVDSTSSPVMVPTVLSGSPRDSINSISSVQYPSTLSMPSPMKKPSFSHKTQRASTNPKHKSSLSKEVTSKDVPEKMPRSSSASNLPVRSSSEMPKIDDELDQVKSLLDKPSLGETQSDDSTDSSDSDELGVGLGLPSRNKIEKSFKERALDLEDSVDPLSGGSTESGFSQYKKPSLLTNRLKHESMYHNQKLATLDSLASPNSLPPVDYVMELIYESAVLVGDVKLMVRCMDCLYISKELKSVKKKLLQSISEIDETLLRQRKVQPARTYTRTNSYESSPQPHPSNSVSPSGTGKSFEKISRTISNLTIGSGRSKTNTSNK